MRIQRKRHLHYENVYFVRNFRLETEIAEGISGFWPTFDKFLSVIREAITYPFTIRRRLGRYNRVVENEVFEFKFRAFFIAIASQKSINFTRILTKRKFQKSIFAMF